MSDYILDDPSLHEDFLAEAGEHFEQMERNFLTLEANPGDLEVLDAIFHSVHNLKGASGFLGLGKVQALAHLGEKVLDDLRKGRMQVDAQVIDLLFETEDLLKALVGDVGILMRKQGLPVDPDPSSLIARLEALQPSGFAMKAPCPDVPAELRNPRQADPNGMDHAASSGTVGWG